MKIIHAADLHLSSSFVGFPQDLKKQRNIELSNNFRLLIGYARQNNIKHIILAGDVFDNNRPTIAIKSFFYNEIENNSDITFYYLKGNHDIENSLTRTDLSNLKTFTNIWTTYIVDNVTITGVELNADNESLVYNSLSLNKDRYNIVVMHGQLGGISNGKVCLINLDRLKGLNIDYLALGHVHTLKTGKLDERGFYAYSGCLEGRGFDETGEKGFIEIDTDTKKVRFIPLNQRQVRVYEIFIKNNDTESIALDEIINKIDASNNDTIRIILKGEVTFEIDDLIKRLKDLLNGKYAYFEIKNQLKKTYKLEDYINNVSLKSEFIKNVMNTSLTEEEKNEIIAIGLMAINGEEVE